MPTIEDNRRLWGQDYVWTEQGDEWSRPWGGVEAQWFGAILPRIHAFVPTDTILEIAPGFGRWTQYLKDVCEHLIVVDLTEKCIKVCKERFSSDSRITYYVNDGKSLNMIPDQSLDFVFSFDSLVHAEAPVLETYLGELAKKLKPDGVGFIHHSNLGEHRLRWSLKSRMPYKIIEFLTKQGFLHNSHWRALTMTASLFERYCKNVGLQCITQELVNWRGQLPIDSFSLFTRKGSIWARPNRIFRNRNFMREADYILYLSTLYSSLSFPTSSKRDKKRQGSHKTIEARLNEVIFGLSKKLKSRAKG